MNFRKFNLKWKIVKHFTRPNQRAILLKLFSILQTHPQPKKFLLCLWNKNFLTELYRNTQTSTFKVLEECSSWTSRNEAVEMFFLTPNTNTVSGEFVKSQVSCVAGDIIFNVKWVDVCKIGEVYWEKLYCKISDLFG